MTRFGFLIEKYTGHVFLDFCKTSKQARLASFRVLKKSFSRRFLVMVSVIEFKIGFNESEISQGHYERITM